MGWIGKMRAFICQFLPTVKRVNPPKCKLFEAVTRSKTGLAEFNYPIDQCLQAWCHLRFSPLINNHGREKMLVCTLGISVHINKEPLLGGTFPAALESGIQVLLLVVAA
jgi:hypothetical protein